MSHYDQTNEQQEIESEIRRMRSMKGYPQPPINDDELLRVARKYFTSMESLQNTVTEIIERNEWAPQPSELRAALEGEASGEIFQPWPNTGCEICGGTTWRPIKLTRDGEEYDAVIECECRRGTKS